MEIKLIVLCLLLIAAPALLFFSIRWLWLKGRYGRLCLSICFLWVLYQIYSSIYPPQSFYVSELERLVKIDLPLDANFQYKTATYPDFHGDYSACFVVKLSEKSFDELKKSISANPFDETNSDGCDEKLKPLNLVANRYILTKQATREDAEIFIELIPKENLAVISWYTW